MYFDSFQIIQLTIPAFQVTLRDGVKDGKKDIHESKTGLKTIMLCYYESVKWRALRALRALVPSMSACPRALVPLYPRAQTFGVPSYHRCWRALVPSCPRAHILGPASFGRVPTFLVLRASVQIRLRSGAAYFGTIHLM